jgi:hypothetical protein
MSRTRTPHVRSGQLLAGRHTLDHIASASLNIATALRAEATGGVSHGRRACWTNNYTHHHFAETKSLGVSGLAFLGRARTGWKFLRWEPCWEYELAAGEDREDGRALLQMQIGRIEG